jgi:hypothetical protein
MVASLRCALNFLIFQTKNYINNLLPNAQSQKRGDAKSREKTASETSTPRKKRFLPKNTSMFATALC